MAKVSVILPIFNVENYLREALDSVCGQTLSDIEIICVNDGSTDSSLDIIREYEARDNRIVVITGPNGGYGKAMNKGLDAATGEYIGILEPDDYVVPEMYGELYDIAVKNDLDFVKADFYRFTRNENGEENLTLEKIGKNFNKYNIILHPCDDPMCVKFTLNTWTGIYKRAFIEEFHIRHNETPGASFQDNGFFFQTFAYARRAMIVDKPYYRNRRDNPNSSVMSKTKVYCMNIGHDYIRALLMRDREVWEKFKYVYWYKKYMNYMFTFQRIGDEYKKEYLTRMQLEFKRARDKGELSKDVFSELEWNKINSLIKNVNSYYDTLRSAKFFRKIVPYIPKPVKRGILKVMSLRKGR